MTSSPPRLAHHIASLLQLSTVVECGSINRAATLLGITQPALKLEEAVGVQLLHRTVKGVVATEAGRLLLDHVKAADMELRRAADAIDALRGRSEGRIVCGTGSASMSFSIPSIVSAFRKQRPGMHFHLIEGQTASLLRPLERGELDFVVGLKIDHEDTPELAADDLVGEQIGVIVGREHPATRGGGAPLNDLLASKQWVLPPPQSLLFQAMERELDRLGARLPSAYVETSSLPAIRHLVQHEGYIALSTSFLFGPDLATGAVQMLSGDWTLPLSRTVIYRRRRDKLSPAAAAFIDLVKQETRRGMNDAQGPAT
jgi:LysR family transcriptional regulator, pca operon transcriptional activator